jgi:leader peptidase (prepilin peptidase)/N-methyltransferase
MTSAWVPAACWFTTCSIVLSWTDVTTRRLPNRLTLVAYAGTLTLLLAAAVYSGEWNRLLSSVLGGIALVAFYLILVFVLPRGMGLGDVKLAASVGTLLGWYGCTVILTATLIGFFLSAVYGIGLLLAGKASVRNGIPFAPFMIAGTLVALVIRA